MSWAKSSKILAMTIQVDILDFRLGKYFNLRSVVFELGTTHFKVSKAESLISKFPD